MVFSQISYEYLLAALIFLALCLVFLFARLVVSRRAKSDPRRQFAIETLEKALAQRETFYLKVRHEGAHAEFQARLEEIDQRWLMMKARQELSHGVPAHPIEANFTLATPDGPKFYKFDSKIVKMIGSAPELGILLQIPSFLQVEKKRHFTRIRPDRDSVKKIALWPLDQNRPLPAESSQMDSPLVLCAQDGSPLFATVENISGSGIGLRLEQGAFAALSTQTRLGDGILCVIEFMSPDNRDFAMSFWFTAEIMNIRQEKDGAKVLGLEFTNWALAEDDSNILRWTYSSPSRGAKPILDLVKHEEEKQWLTFKNSCL